MGGEAASFVGQEPTPDLGELSMPRFKRFDNTFYAKNFVPQKKKAFQRGGGRHKALLSSEDGSVRVQRPCPYES